MSAKDKASGKEAKITIKANSGLSDEEIQQMVRDGESHAEEDHKQRELVDARNQCDALIHSVKKTLTEQGDKVGAEDKAAIEAAIKDAEEALKSNDKEAIEAKMQALGTASHKMAEQMQAEAAKANAGAAGAGAKKPDEDVVDAEFEEVKDTK